MRPHFPSRSGSACHTVCSTRLPLCCSFSLLLTTPSDFSSSSRRCRRAAVFESMNNIHFQVRKSSFTCGRFHTTLVCSLLVLALLGVSGMASWYPGQQKSVHNRRSRIGLLRGSKSAP